MAIDFEKLMQNEAFREIEPEKIEALKALSEQINGKSMPEVVGLITGYSKVLNSGKPISSKERELMLNVVLESMEEEDKKKYGQLIQMIRMMNA